MSSKGVCVSTVLSCTGGACSRGYKRGERGREAPKSLLVEELIETSANIGVQRSVFALPVVRSVVFYRVGRPPFYRHKEGRCTCTGDRGSHRLLPESRGVQCSSTVRSTLWGMAPVVAVVLGIVLVSISPDQRSRTRFPLGEGSGVTTCPRGGNAQHLCPRIRTPAGLTKISEASW